MRKEAPLLCNQCHMNYSSDAESEVGDVCDDCEGVLRLFKPVYRDSVAVLLPTDIAYTVRNVLENETLSEYNDDTEYQEISQLSPIELAHHRLKDMEDRAAESMEFDRAATFRDARREIEKIAAAAAFDEALKDTNPSKG